MTSTARRTGWVAVLVVTSPLASANIISILDFTTADQIFDDFGHIVSRSPSTLVFESMEVVGHGHTEVNFRPIPIPAAATFLVFEAETISPVLPSFLYPGQDFPGPGQVNVGAAGIEHRVIRGPFSGTLAIDLAGYPPIASFINVSFGASHSPGDFTATISNLRFIDDIAVSDEWLENHRNLIPIVPAPTAALLAMLGLPMIGWVRRRTK